MKRYASIRLVAAAALLIASGGCKDDNPGTGLNGPAVLAIQNAGAEPRRSTSGPSPGRSVRRTSP